MLKGPQFLRMCGSTDPVESSVPAQFATSPNCAGFRFRGALRHPSSLTFAPSRPVHAHGPRQAASSETPDSLGAMA